MVEPQVATGVVGLAQPEVGEVKAAAAAAAEATVESSEVAVGWPVASLHTS